jgi:hypothetical protein
MERRTQAFVGSVLEAQDRLWIEIAQNVDGSDDGREVREDIAVKILVQAGGLEMATTFTRSEYLEFPAITLEDVMKSLTSWPSAKAPFYFRMDIVGMPVMGLMASDGLTSLYRLPPQLLLN